MVIQVSVSIFLLCACWAMVTSVRACAGMVKSLLSATAPREIRTLLSSLSEVMCARAEAMRAETSKRSKQAEHVVNVGEASKSMFAESVEGVDVNEIRLPEYPSGNDPAAGMTFSHDMSELIGD